MEITYTLGKPTPFETDIIINVFLVSINFIFRKYDFLCRSLKINCSNAYTLKLVKFGKY
jgi:hypothetical protein